MSFIPIICIQCGKGQLYKTGAKEPEHKVRLLIYHNPPKDYYFCDLQCLYTWTNRLTFESSKTPNGKVTPLKLPENNKKQ